MAHLDALEVSARKDREELDRATMVCPKCQCFMAKRMHRSQDGVILDVCPICHGIWFDAGEYANYCRVPVEKRPPKKKYAFVLFCEPCQKILKKPQKEQNVCEDCGGRLNLAIPPTPRPFWCENPWCAVFVFLLGMAVFYFMGFRLCGNVLQASALSAAVGPIYWIYVIRPLIYGKFFYAGPGPFRGQDIDLD